MSKMRDEIIKTIGTLLVEGQNLTEGGIATQLEAVRGLKEGLDAYAAALEQRVEKLEAIAYMELEAIEDFHRKVEEAAETLSYKEFFEKTGELIRGFEKLLKDKGLRSDLVAFAQHEFFSESDYAGKVRAFHVELFKYMKSELLSGKIRFRNENNSKGKRKISKAQAERVLQITAAQYMVDSMSNNLELNPLSYIEAHLTVTGTILLFSCRTFKDYSDKHFALMELLKDEANT